MYFKEILKIFYRKTLTLTKREELSFFTVLALPNASRMGLAWSN